MGVGTESGGGRWLSVVKGKLTQRVPAGTENAVQRELSKGPNAGNVVNELQHTFLEGRLEKVYVQETDFGKSWVFVVNDGSEEWNLTVGYSSGYAVGVLARLPNVDLSDNIKIKSFYIKGDDDKYRGYLTINQGGQKIEKAYTKEEPNGLPEIERVVVNGEPQWDSTQRMLFFERLISERIMPGILKANPLAAVDESQEDVNDTPPDEESDLPF